MNKSQFKKAVAIVKKDANLQRYYYMDGDTCVIGGMALATKFPKKVLIDAGSANIDAITGGVQYRNASKIRAHLKKHFGLITWHMSQLQEINDNVDDLKLRRRKLIEKLKEFYEASKE